MIDTGQTGYVILYKDRLWVNEVTGQFHWSSSSGALNSFGNCLLFGSGSDYYKRREFIKEEKKKVKVIKVKLFVEFKE